MANKNRRRTSSHLEIIHRAARFRSWTVEELFEKATRLENVLRMQRGENIVRKVVVNLRKIPDYVLKYARELYERAIAHRTTVRTRSHRERYRRFHPALQVA